MRDPCMTMRRPAPQTASRAGASEQRHRHKASVPRVRWGWRTGQLQRFAHCVPHALLISLSRVRIHPAHVARLRAVPFGLAIRHAQPPYCHILRTVHRKLQPPPGGAARGLARGGLTRAALGERRRRRWAVGCLDWEVLPLGGVARGGEVTVRQLQREAQLHVIRRERRQLRNGGSRRRRRGRRRRRWRGRRRYRRRRRRRRPGRRRRGRWRARRGRE